MRRAAPPPASPGDCGRPGSTPSARGGAGPGAAGAAGQRSLPWREPRAGLRSPPAPPLSRRRGKRRRKAPFSPPSAGLRQEECAWGRVLPSPQASHSLCPGGAGKGPRSAAPAASPRGRDPAPAVAAGALPGRSAGSGAKPPASCRMHVGDSCSPPQLDRLQLKLAGKLLACPCSVIVVVSMRSHICLFIFFPTEALFQPKKQKNPTLARKQSTLNACVKTTQI